MFLKVIKEKHLALNGRQQIFTQFLSVDIEVQQTTFFLPDDEVYSSSSELLSLSIKVKFPTEKQS